MFVEIYRKIIEFFGFNAYPIAALEIGATSVKILQLSQLGGDTKVDCYAIEPLENMCDTACLVTAIKNVFLKSGIKTKKVSVAIASGKVISKTVKMPSQLSVKDIAYEIELEMDKYFPYPVDELAFDYDILGLSKNSKDEVDVLLTAVKLKHITDLTHVVLASNLVATVVDVDTYAIARAFEVLMQKNNIQTQDKIFGIINIGSNSILMIIVNNDRILYSCEQVLQDTSQLVSHILKLYKDFVALYDDILVDSIYLFGCQAQLSGIDKLICQQLQISTYMINPASIVRLEPGINKSQFDIDAWGLMLCFGLALRAIN